jgi:hypothetical protein
MSKSLQLFFCFLLLSACKTTVTTKGACGDGFLDPGEACDGAAFSVSECNDLGFHFQSGPITCLADCSLNLAVCSGRCGDGELQAAGGEHCEGGDLNGQSCQLLNLGGGALSCNDECHFDTSGCETSAVCGDGTIHEPFEDCEDDDLQGETCQTLGYHGGALGCTQDCRYDLEPCEAFGRCGDDEIQALYGERCEGTDLEGETCETLGWYGGTLLCGNDCNYDETGCAAVGRCGDGEIQTENGEECDGTGPGGISCVLIGYHAGLRVCTDACRIDDSDCLTYGRCGDGIRQQQYEECEGVELGNNDCIFFGYYGGTLSCTTQCVYDLASCMASGMCGDNIIQNGEICDGTNLVGNTCLSLGYEGGGTLGCLNTCLDFDRNGCSE